MVILNSRFFSFKIYSQRVTSALIHAYISRHRPWLVVELYRDIHEIVGAKYIKNASCSKRVLANHRRNYKKKKTRVLYDYDHGTARRLLFRIIIIINTGGRRSILCSRITGWWRSANFVSVKWIRFVFRTRCALGYYYYYVPADVLDGLAGRARRANIRRIRYKYKRTANVYLLRACTCVGFVPIAG